VNCPNCNNEIFDEEATFCPKCGKPLSSEGELEQKSVDLSQKQTDLVLAAALLTIIAGAFMASIGYTGIYQYQALLDYYGSVLASELVGFLIFGVIDILCAAFAIVGALFMLKRKQFKISILGIILLLASVFITYLTITQYQYSFVDILLFSEISVFILSILSGALIITAKNEFTG
jgi:hypothetical protein